MSAQETVAVAGYGELLRGNRNFRYLWFGQIVSLLGDWFNLIASAALVGALTQSGLAVGSLFVVRMLAPFVVSPLAGVVADRYNRMLILIISDLIRSAVVFCFLFVRQPGDVWLLYALTAAQLAVSGFFFPARNAILPQITRPHELGTANAISSVTWSTMLAIGAALGGLVSGIWGIYPAFVIDGFTFLLSAVLLLQVRVGAMPALDAAEKTVGAALRQYVDGLRYLRGHVDVFVIALQKAINALFLSSGFQVIQVAIAQDVFVIGEGGGISMGLMFALAGVGTGVGPIVARRITGDNPSALKKAIAVGYLIGAIGMVVSAPLPSFFWVLVGTALRGIGGGIIWVFSTQLLLQSVPGQVQGRIFATEFMIFYLASALASSIVGAGLDSSLGISGVIWWMAILSVIPMLSWAWWIRRPETLQR